MNSSPISTCTLAVFAGIVKWRTRAIAASQSLLPLTFVPDSICGAEDDHGKTKIRKRCSRAVVAVRTWWGSLAEVMWRSFSFFVGECGLFLRSGAGQSVGDDDGEYGVCEDGCCLLLLCEIFLHLESVTEMRFSEREGRDKRLDSAKDDG